MAGYCTSVQPYFHEPQASEIQHKKFLASTIEYELTDHCNSILRGFCRSDCKGLTVLKLVFLSCIHVATM